jgi:hypothetical protein
MVNNLETARSQLDDLSQAMNLEQLQQTLAATEGETSPTSPAEGAGILQGLCGTFEIKIGSQFRVEPRLFGLPAAVYFALVHPSKDHTVGKMASGQTADISLNPPVEGLFLEMHFSNALSDNLMGKTWVALGEHLGDHDIHDVMVDLLGFGRIGIRIRKIGERGNDVEFYFRRTFRALKRAVQESLFTKVSCSRINSIQNL